MSSQHPDGTPVELEAPRAAADPVVSIEDPRAMQILSSELSTLVSARGLAYNEAFTRVGMFLSLLSMSFVGLALIAQATSFADPFLGIAVVILTFDFVVGLLTLGRVLGTTADDLRAVQGMARIRHGYGRIAPFLQPYFTGGTHDDLPGVMMTYGTPTPGIGGVLYALTTSTGMMALIVALVGGMLAGVLALLAGAGTAVAFIVGAVGAVAVFLAAAAGAGRFFIRDQASLEVRFPGP